MRRVPCLGHMLHNAVTKSLATEDIKRLLAHCRRIVSLFHCSQVYRTKLQKVLKDLKIPEKQLINDVVTRWGSKYKMLHRLKELMIATNNVLMDDRKYRDLTISWQQASLIDVILKSLEGFHTLTDSLSGENEVTISSAIPLLRHINNLCKTEKEEDETSKAIKDTIKDYFQLKLQVPELLMFLRVAEVLDPRYQELSADDASITSLWLDLPSLEDVKREILDRAPGIVNSKESSEPSTPAQPPTKKGKKSLVNLLMSNASASASAAESENAVTPQLEMSDKLERELNFFVRLKAGHDEDVLQWWKSHRVELPLLSQYARYVLSACASSVPSERLFSISGNIISKKRNALKPGLVDQLVFLAMNKDMI